MSDHLGRGAILATLGVLLLATAWVWYRLARKLVRWLATDVDHVHVARHLVRLEARVRALERRRPQS